MELLFRITFLRFCIVTITVTFFSLAGCASARNDPKTSTRTINFPAEYSLGDLNLIPQDYPERTNPAHWKPWGQAWGEVLVPADASVWLRICPDVLDKLQALKNLKAGDIQAISFPRKAGGQHLSYVSHLTNLQDISPGRAITDDDLQLLKIHHSLRRLYLQATPITGTGFIHLKSLPELEGLYLQRTKLRDENLVHLKHLPSLKILSLMATTITDEGMKHLRACLNLRELELPKTVTGRGLSALAGHPKLRKLNLSRANIDHQGIQVLPEFPQLQSLRLPSGLQLNDHDMQSIGRIKSLKVLGIEKSRIPPDGFKYLRSHNSLTDLTLFRSQTAEGGLEYLAAIPNLQWLSFHGSDISNCHIKNLYKAPRLKKLTLAKTAVTGPGLDTLSRMKSLRYLDLSELDLTNADLAPLTKLPLEELDLSKTSIGDQATKQLAKIKTLHVLNLRQTHITSAGLQNLAELPDLRTLNLSSTNIDDRACAALQNYSSLRYLDLNNTGVTDAGLAQLVSLNNIRSLDLGNTSVSDKGIDSLLAMENLEGVSLVGNGVTQDGVARLLAQTRMGDKNVAHRPYDRIKVKDKAYNFTAQTVNGDSFRLIDFRGKYVLLEFWAMMCGGCVDQIPHIHELHQKLGSRQDFAVISLSRDTDADRLRKFYKEHDMDWTCGHFQNEQQRDLAYKRFGITSIPRLILVGPVGKILDLHVPAHDLLATVEKHLPEQ
jgi:internalin A